MKKRTIFFCGFLMFIILLVILKNRLILGDDTIFHLNRIIALSTAIYNGDYFPKVFFEQNFNYGYGSPLFYSCFFLIPFAFLKLYMSTIKVFILLQKSIFVVSFISSGFLARRFSKNKLVIIISALIYTFNPYHFTTIILRAAIGESFAISILPLVILGFLDFINNKRIIKLVIGMSLLALAHNLSFVVMLFFLVVLTLINMHKISKKLLLYLIIAIVFTAGLTAFYTFPLIEGMSVVKVEPYNFDFYSQLLDFKSLFNYASVIGVNPNMYLSIGLLAFMLVLFSLYFDKSTVNIIFVILTILTILMTSQYFPKIFLRPFIFIQFPWRILAFTSVFSIIPITITLDNLYFKYNWLILFIFVLRVFTYSNYNDIEYVNSNWSDKQLNDDMIVTSYGYSLKFNSSQLAMAEYIINPWIYNYRESEYVIIGEDKKYDISMIDYDLMSWEIDLKQDQLLQIPRLYYPGYKLYLDGQEVNVFFSDDQLIKVKGEKGYHEYKLVFKGTTIQNASNYISFITFAIFTYLIVLKKIR